MANADATKELNDKLTKLAKRIMSTHFEFQEKYKTFWEKCNAKKMQLNHLAYKSNVDIEHGRADLISFAEDIKMCKGHLHYRLTDRLQDMDEYLNKMFEKQKSTAKLLEELKEASKRKRSATYSLRHFCFRLFLFALQILLLTMLGTYKFVIVVVCHVKEKKGVLILLILLAIASVIWKEETMNTYEQLCLLNFTNSLRKLL